MKPQPHLFDKTEARATQEPVISTVTRVLSTGSTVKLTLEPVGEERVRIIAYYRKARHSDRFVRSPGEEGHIVAFEKLGLELTYQALFGQAA